MAAKKTATKTGDVKRAKKAQEIIATAAASSTAGAVGMTTAKYKKYNSIGDVARAASKGALPRGAKFVIAGGRVRLRVETRHTGETLFDGDAGDVALYGLRKAGFVATKGGA
jgi:hypothetical protein